MNREHWKALLPKIEAFANGEDVQALTSVGKWRSFEEISFTGNPKDYRIAPKEKTGWLNVYKDGAGGFHETREMADYYGGIGPRIACIQITYKEGDGL